MHAMKSLMALTVAAALLSACSPTNTQSDAPTPSAYSNHSEKFVNWPATLDDFRFHWSAASGVDLTTGPGVLLRAYLESSVIAEYTFDPSAAYPGFFHATPPNADQRAPGAQSQYTDIRPLGIDNTKSPQDARPHYGYVPFHILEISPMGDGYRATVCTAEYASFIESTTRPGKFISLATDDKTGQPVHSGPTSSIYVHRIEFTQHDPRVGLTPAQPPTTPQTGPAPAPADDVFGNWFITAESTQFWGPIGQPEKPLFPTTDLEQRCADSMPQNEAERTAMMTGYKDAPPPSGSAVPGWPLQTK